MKPKKTKAELEERIERISNRAGVMILAIILIACLIIAGLCFYFGVEQLKYKSQLQSCQEKVPVWTLETECFYPDEAIPIYIYAQYNFTNYTEYLGVKEEIDKLDICEVIE